MKNLCKGAIILSFFHFYSLSEEKYLEIAQKSPDANKAVQSAVREISESLAKKFIGSLRLEEQKKQIQKIVLAFSNRYILYTKTAAPQKTTEGLYILPVTIGFSEKNFKQILLKEGIFYAQSSKLRVFPLILFEDQVNNEFSGWWFRDNKLTSMKIPQIFDVYNAIQDHLMAYGFYVINPAFVGVRDFVPDNLWFKKQKKKHIFNLARFFQSYLVLTGFMKLRETGVDSLFNLNIELEIYHTESGRLLADIKYLKKLPKQDNPNLWSAIESFLQMEKDFAKNLGAQLQFAYESGQISSYALKMTIQGELNYQQSQEFKKQLMSQSSSVTELTEHIIRGKTITYMASTRTPLDAVSKEIKNLSLPHFDMEVFRIRKNEIVLKVNSKK